MLVAIAILALIQSAVGGEAAPPRPPTASATRTVAVRAARAPVIDGRDDEPVWQQATRIDAFYEFDPVEGKDPRFRTEGRVAYDSRNFYVFVRMYDPKPDRILKLLARRDVRTASDQIKIVIDSYHDRRSGYEFAVNPAGVKRDFSISNDNHEDPAWDGVWDVATTVDSLGWTAEFRIPLSQLRYGAADVHTFGFGIWRDIDRYKERVSWPLFRRTDAGFVSQLGEVTGLRGLSSPRRLELSPYAVTRNVTRQVGDGSSHPQQLTAGVDLKYGVSSNLTLDATVNPDFGQVEADPAVLNLSAVETFYQERRPFFVEGGGLLSFPINCFVVRDCGSENLFYSRRIGRAPQLTDSYGDASSPQGASILGAAKLTGRTPGGLSVGLLEAVTGQEQGTQDRTIEPRSSYSVLRATQDLRKGETTIGVIGTVVDRSEDQWTSPLLRSSALVGGVDLRHRVGRFEFSGLLVGSRVGGSADAIAATQTNAVHYFQRPDAGLDYDPTRTSLTGTSEQLRFAKVSGARLHFETTYQRVSAGFEANDLGFLRRADWQSQATWAQLSWNQPGPFFRQLYWNFNQWNEWSAGGLTLDHGVGTNVHFSLPNNVWLHGGISGVGFGTTYCDLCARGGPAFRVDGGFSSWAGIEGDGRQVIVPGLWLNYGRRDGGRSRSIGISPYLSFRVATRWTSSVGFNYNWNRDDRQWYDNYVDSAAVTHYTFAHLEQRTASATFRVDFTASPTLTVQLYAQPFVSKGRYTDIRELADPRAPAYADRFQPYGDPVVHDDPAQFNYQQFRSNAVLRWEYRPGSTLFLVWQHGREDSESRYGDRSLFGDVSQLFRTPADNTILLKLSYWIDR
jgi:Domain of unknown function (DUF5916)/Carbohydrate family 9 binding domain-like